MEAKELYIMNPWFSKPTALVTLDTGSPRAKPLPSGAEAFAAVTAHSGVDQTEHDEYVALRGAKGTAEFAESSYTATPSETDQCSSPLETPCT